MASLSLLEAAEQARTSKVDIWRAIQEGTLPAQKTVDGLAIDPAELFRAFEPRPPEGDPIEQDGAASLEVSERPETGAPETAAMDGMAVLGVLGAELKGLLGLPPEAPGKDELRADSAEKQEIGSTERNVQLDVKLPTEAAKATGPVAEFAALPEERGKPWWRRLVGWIQTRRGRAGRKRLRERL